MLSSQSDGLVKLDGMGRWYCLSYAGQAPSCHVSSRIAAIQVPYIAIITSEAQRTLT